MRVPVCGLLWLVRVGLFGVALGLAPLCAEDATDMYVKFFFSFKEGELAERSGDYPKALEHYTNAGGLLEQIRKADPTWRKELVTYRTEVTAERLQKLRSLVTVPTPVQPATQPYTVPQGGLTGLAPKPDQTTTPPPPPPSGIAPQSSRAPTTGIVPAMPRSLEFDPPPAPAPTAPAGTSTPGSRLADLRQALDDVMTMQQQLDKLRGERDNLQNRLDQALRQTGAIEKMQTDLSSAQEQLRTLQSERVNLQSRLDDTQRQLQSLQDLRVDLTKAQQEIQQTRLDRDAARSQVDDARKQSTLLSEENTMLKSKLTEAEARGNIPAAELSNLRMKLDQTRGELDAARAQLDETRAQLTQALSQTQNHERTSGSLTAQLQSAQQEIEQLRGQVARNAAASATPAASSGGPSELLQIENDLLRDIVNRQMDEQERRAKVKEQALAELAKVAKPPPRLVEMLEILGSPLIRLTDAQMKWLHQKTPGQLPVGSPAVASSAPAAATPPGAKRSATPPSREDEPLPIGEELPNTDGNVLYVPPDMRRIANDAISAFSSGDLPRAIKGFQQILARYPANVYALSNLGVALIQKEDFAQAEQYLRRSVEAAPNDGGSHSLLGVVYVKTGRYREAIDSLTRATSLNPSDAEAHNYLGISCAKDGSLFLAEQELRKALELNPNYVDALFNLAVVYATQDPPSKDLARRHYGKAVSMGLARNPEFEKVIEYH